MKHIIHKGEFVGHDSMAPKDVTWGVEVWRTGGDAPAVVGDLTFDADTPVEIAYDGKAKHEPVCGSSCTLRVISPGDRTYIDLYTVEAATVGVTIRRDGALYWVGTIDPEFYEEPYESAAGYTVSLTFTDLGVLDRMKYNSAGMRSLRSIISECVERAGLLPELAIDSSLMSLRRKEKNLLPIIGGFGWRPILSSSRPVTLDDIYARSDNFYDEEGEASTLDEVLKGILQPLALRIEQRAGKLWVYDLNGLFESGVRREVEWSGDSQTLSVDEVKNNAVITWSPYADTAEMLPEECWPEEIEVDPNETNLDSLDPKEVNGATIYTYHLTQELEVWGDPETDEEAAQLNKQYGFRRQVNNADLTDAGFSIWLTDEGRNVDLLAGGAKVFKIVPHFDGQEAEGIALRYPIVKLAERIVEYHPMWSQVVYRKVKDIARIQAGVANTALYSATATPQPLFRTKEVALPPMADGAADLKITMDLLYDMRFNPFEQSVNFPKPYDQKNLEEWWNANYQFLYVPVRICYRQNGGDGATYVYDQGALAGRGASGGKMLTLAESMQGGSWVKEITTTSGIKVTGISYLAYYDTDDRAERCGVFGWKTNRQRITNYNGKLQTALAKGDDGQFIPYPPKEIQGPQGGMMWIEVMSARWWPVRSTDYPRQFNYTYDAQWARMEWVLCKMPQLEIVSTSPLERTIDDEDVEYRGTINPDAKDDIEISTICGTKAGGIPSARGAYFDSNGEQIETLTRAGRTSQVEDLLIGTLYSQYATRHTKIEGEATVTGDGLTAWTERCQPGKIFIMASETQDLRTCCGERMIIELSPDEYTKYNNG